MKPGEFRENREALDLNQEELSEILGLSGYKPVSHYETGFRNPSLLIQALMRIFKSWPQKKSRELREDLRNEMVSLKKIHQRKSHGR